MISESKIHTCCFFGHRKISEAEEIKKRVYSEVENLIVNKRVRIFLFGSKSEFNDLCHQVVTELKEKYSHIKRIYVRAEFQEISEKFKKYLLESYEDTYYPKEIENSGKASYVERNRAMINSSQYCVAYYDKNYLPPIRKSHRTSFEYQLKSGTKLAYDFAVKRKKEIINIYGE